MTSNGIDRAQVEAQLARMLASASFRQAERSATLLRYLVSRSLHGDGDRLKEYTVGVEALGRGVGFDPRTDPIVRAEASRLRGRLERYYAGPGAADTLLIELPKGAYTLQFSQRSVDASETSASPPPLNEAFASSPRPRRWRRWPMVAVVAAAAVFGAGRWSAGTLPRAAEVPLHVDMTLQNDEELGSEVGTDVVIAPNGSAVVFVSRDSVGVPHLRVRRFDGTPPANLPGTSGARGPFWSPDSRWVAFWVNDQLLKIAVDGGEPVVLTAAQDLLGGHWGDDDTIIAALEATSGKLWRVGTTPGTTPTVALDLTDEGISPQWPQLLPDGVSVVYTAVTTLGDDRARIEIASLADGRREVLVEGGTFGRYVEPGYLTYVNQGTLFAVPFDPDRRAMRGTAVPVLRDVAYSSTFGFAPLSFSETGVLVYRPRASDGRVTLSRIDADGTVTPLLTQPGTYGWPALSPDGRRLAVSSVVNGDPMLTMYALTGTARAVWTQRGLDAATWTPDGRHVVARRPKSLVWIGAEGGAPLPLLDDGRLMIPWSFARDGRTLAFAMLDSVTHLDLWTVAIDRPDTGLRSSRPRALLQSPAVQMHPAISRDGAWLAYTSYGPDGPSVFVKSLMDTSHTVLVARGGRAPRWSRTGRRLYFLAGTQRLMSVTFVDSGGQFVPDTPVPFASIRLADTGVLPNYDVGVDDGAVVALLPVRPPVENQVRLIRGFPAMLQQVIP